MKGHLTAILFTIKVILVGPIEWLLWSIIVFISEVYEIVKPVSGTVYFHSNLIVSLNNIVLIDKLEGELIGKMC